MSHHDTAKEATHAAKAMAFENGKACYVYPGMTDGWRASTNRPSERYVSSRMITTVHPCHLDGLLGGRLLASYITLRATVPGRVVLEDLGADAELPFVTHWQDGIGGGLSQGNYFETLAEAQADFLARCQTWKRGE